MFCKYVILVDEDVRVVVGWWCALKGVVYGGVVGLWWVWLGKCRDGRYAVNASHSDVWVVCARLLCALSLISLVFGEVFFGGSASLHDWLLESAFSVTYFRASFLGDGMKGHGVL